MSQYEVEQLASFDRSEGLTQKQKHTGSIFQDYANVLLRFQNFITFNNIWMMHLLEHSDLALDFIHSGARDT